MFWCNPPFSKLRSVVKKIRREDGYGILICPDWRKKKWFNMAHSMARKRYFIEGKSLFEDDQGRALPPPEWGTWALLVDGTFYTSPEIPEGDYRPKTHSKKRRTLRERKQAYDEKKREQEIKDEEEEVEVKTEVKTEVKIEIEDEEE